MIENECKTLIGCLTFISVKNIFHDKTDLRLFYFDVATYMYFIFLSYCPVLQNLRSGLICQFSGKYLIEKSVCTFLPMLSTLSTRWVSTTTKLQEKLKGQRSRSSRLEVLWKSFSEKFCRIHKKTDGVSFFGADLLQSTPR